MSNSYLNNLAEIFYKLANSNYIIRTAQQPANAIPTTGTGASENVPAQGATPMAQRGGRLGLREEVRSQNLSWRNTKLGRFTKRQLFDHYDQMAKKINSSNIIETFDPKGAWNKGSIYICKVEGGEGVEAVGDEGSKSFPALLVKFYNSPNNPEIGNMSSYVKELIEEAGINAADYMIESTNNVVSKDVDPQYSKYVYVIISTRGVSETNM